jgi:hypothetical protein
MSLNVENAADAVLALVVAQLEEARPVQGHSVLHQGPVGGSKGEGVVALKSSMVSLH